MRMSKKAVVEGKKNETQEENRTPKQNAVKKETAEQKEGAQQVAQQKTAATVTTASAEATCGSPARVYRCRYGSSVILKKDYWAAKSIDSTCTPVWAWLKEDGGIDRLLTPEELIKNCP